MVLCNGWTIDPFSLSDEQITSIWHVFFREEPTHAKFSLWCSAISSLGEGTTWQTYTLGPFLLPPHLEVYWYTNSNNSVLYCMDNGSTRYQVFTQLAQSCSTRHGTQFVWSHQNEDAIFPELMLLAPRWSLTQEQFYIPCWFFPIQQMNDKHSLGLFTHLGFQHSGRTCTLMVMGSGYEKDSSMEHYWLLTMGPLCKKSRWTSALPLW